jgi:hypothetical protein
MRSGGAPVLARFEQSPGRAAFVPETNLAVPARGYFDNQVLLGADGIFWIVADNDGLYSYDPATPVSRQHLDWENTGRDFIGVAFAADGTLFLQEETAEWTNIALGPNELFQYTPDSEQLIPVALPPGRWPMGSSLLVDNAGRLWYSASGWREPDGSWRRLHPSPSRWFSIMQTSDMSLWGMPASFLVSRDGAVWFASEKGLAWFNPETNVGCWVVADRAAVVMDDLGGLWLTTRDTLYHLPPVP